MNGDNKKHKDYWTIIFSVISIILANLSIFVPSQRLIILSFTILSMIFAFILYYINKINILEDIISQLKEEINTIKKDILERFNYLKEISNLKVEIEMLKKKKRAQINLELIFKILIAIILIYVIFSVLKSL